MGISFLCIFWFLSAGAQDWQIRHYTVDDGLPHNIGFDILQDDKGFIWLGTDNGLARFDGKNFVSLGVGDGLKGSSIISLSKGKSGEIYCSAYKKGVSRIDYPHITQTQFGVAADFKAILFHPKLYFFKEEVFTIENRQELNQATLVHHQNNVLTNIHLKFEDGQLSMEKLFSQELWNELRYQKAHNFNAQNPLNPVRVYASAEGALFFTTNQGLFQYHGAGDFTLLANGKFDAIDGTQDGTIYAAGPGKLFSWDGKHLDTLLEDKRIDCEQFKVTEEGLVCWFNKDRISLWIHQLKTPKTDQLNKLLASRSSFSFLQKDSNGNFWISTNGDGLFSISKSMIRDFSSALSLQQKFVNVISESPEGDILLGTRGGLVSLTLTPNGENTSYPFTHNHILSQTEIFRIFNISSETSDPTHRALFSSMEGTWELEWASQNLTKRNIPISNNLGFDPSGRIYRSGTGGISVNPINHKDSLLAFVNGPGISHPSGFGDFLIAHIGDFWFGSHTCLYHLKRINMRYLISQMVCRTP